MIFIHYLLDIDECSYFSNLCINGECENTLGMFRCRCNQGFKQDVSGGNCTGKVYWKDLMKWEKHALRSSQKKERECFKDLTKGGNFGVFFVPMILESTMNFHLYKCRVYRFICSTHDPSRIRNRTLRKI